MEPIPTQHASQPSFLQLSALHSTNDQNIPMPFTVHAKTRAPFLAVLAAQTRQSQQCCTTQLCETQAPVDRLRTLGFPHVLLQQLLRTCTSHASGKQLVIITAPIFTFDEHIRTCYKQH